MNDKLSTKELIEFLTDNRYELFGVTSIIRIFFGCHHFISYRKSYIWDEYLCDTTIKWTKEEFIHEYADSVWLLD